VSKESLKHLLMSCSAHLPSVVACRFVRLTGISVCGLYLEAPIPHPCPCNVRAAPSVKAVDAYGQLLVDVMSAPTPDENASYYSAVFGVSVLQPGHDMHAWSADGLPLDRWHATCQHGRI
jgi:hypothetical protein